MYVAIKELNKEERGIMRRIISMLSSYGIISEYRERGSLKYDLRSQHAYEIAREKILERVIKRYRDYVEVINKHKKGLSPSKIAKQLDLSKSIVKEWIKNEGNLGTR
jgi:transposase